MGGSAGRHGARQSAARSRTSSPPGAPPAPERFADPAGVEGRFELVQSVIDETRALFHRLRVAAEAVHGQGEVSAGRRGVLLDLARHGAMTVPALARLRPVSRQHIQTLVNPMLEDGYVELVPNPAHRRSSLVRLTARGARLVESMLARERALLDRLQLAASDPELRRAALVLRRLRAALEEAPSFRAPPR